MEFGIPSKRRVKQEKYPNTPVITLVPFEGENTSRKIEFNKKAYEVMGLQKDEINMVAFSFNRSDYRDNAVVNANSFDSDASLKVAKNGKVSNKAHYEEIKERYEVPLEQELELALIDSGKTFGEQTVFSLVTLDSLNKASEQAEDVAQDTQEEGFDDNRVLDAEPPKENSLPPMDEYAGDEVDDDLPFIR